MEGLRDGFRYHAFISYSHADEAWARWLHRALETYRVPARLHRASGGAMPKRLFPVFRDRDELPSAAELGAVIQKALRESRALIVICSPRSAKSRWVNEEIRYFKSLGRERQVFALIVDGEPHAADPAQECFAEALQHAFAADGATTAEAVEPIAADARAGGDGRHAAFLKLAAGLLGVGFDELRQREAIRQRWQAAGVAALVVLVAGALTALWQWQVRERQRALDAQALEVRKAALYENGRRELLAGQQARAAVYLVGALELGLDTPALRFMLGRAMREVDAFQRRYSIGAPVIQMQIDPSGKRLAVLDDDGALHLLDVRDGIELSKRTGDHADWSVGPFFSQNGNTVLLSVLRRGQTDAELLIGASEAADWSDRRPISGAHFEVSVEAERVAFVDSDERAHVLAIDGSGFDSRYQAATAVRLVADGRQLLVGRVDGAVLRLNADTGAALASYEGLSESVKVLRQSPDGELLAAAGSGGEVRVWEVKSRRLRFTAGQAQEVTELEFSTDSQRLRTSGKDGNAVWDTRRGQLLLADKAGNFLGNPASFVRNGEQLAQIKDGSLILSDAATGQSLLTLDGHTGPPVTFAAGEAPEAFYSGGEDGSIVHWNLPTTASAVFDARGSATGFAEGDLQVPVAASARAGLFAFGRTDGVTELRRQADAGLLRRLPGRHGRVTALAFAADGAWLAVGDQSGQVAVWSLADESGPHWLAGPGGATALLRWGPDGHHLAGAFLGARTRVWTWSEGTVAADFAPRDATKALAFSPDGRRLAIGQQGHAKLWNLATGKLVWDQPLPVESDEKPLANVFSFRPDGAQLFASLFRRKLFVLDAASGRMEATAVIDSSNSFSSGGFSPDGGSIVLGDYSKLAYRWTPADGRVLALEGHTSAVGAAVSHPSGALVATASDDGTIKLWEAASGALLDTLAHHQAPVRYDNLLFSSDGGSLISAGQDQRVQINAVPLEQRSLPILQKIIACKTAWVLVDEALQPAAIKSAGCDQL